jgi:uncharacterized protein (DUF58 family)
VRARTIVEGALAGLHRSPLHGSSVEFAEHKEYAPGDELKHLDWKAYGKVDRFYVKKYEQETELSCQLVLDCSASMRFRGDGLSKLDYAAHLAAAIGYLLLRQQDRVGLVGFAAGQASLPLPPRSRGNHLHELCAELERLSAAPGGQGPTDVAGAVERVTEQLGRRPALIVVASDLFTSGEALGKALARARARRHDVAVLHVLDRQELDLPYEGPTLFESLEDERKLLVDPRAIRRSYLEELERFLSRTRRACADADVTYQLAVSDQPLEQALLDFLAARGSPARGKAPLQREAR